MSNHANNAYRNARAKGATVAVAALAAVYAEQEAHAAEATGYPAYTKDGTIYIDASCGCPVCSEGRQPGHGYCSPAPDVLLSLEAQGRVSRAYTDNAWRWFWNW